MFALLRAQTPIFTYKHRIVSASALQGFERMQRSVKKLSREFLPVQVTKMEEQAIKAQIDNKSTKSP